MIPDWITSYELYVKMLLVLKVIFSDIDYKVIMIACIWYWFIKHVLWLLNAYVCVYVCICDDIIPTEFVAHASQLIFYREIIDSYRFLWHYARKQPMLQPSISSRFCIVGISFWESLHKTPGLYYFWEM